jgi:hypothetical protein
MIATVYKVFVKCVSFLSFFINNNLIHIAQTKWEATPPKGLFVHFTVKKGI